MAKKTALGKIKLQVPAGKANPSPPIGPALGQRGLNIMEFCKQFNALTKNFEPGLIIPVIITYYSDKTFTFILKQPPVSAMLKKIAGINKGSATCKTIVASLTMNQISDIAKNKLSDLTAGSLAAAVKTILGTARSMGISVEVGEI